MCMTSAPFFASAKQVLKADTCAASLRSCHCFLFSFSCADVTTKVDQSQCQKAIADVTTEVDQSQCQKVIADVTTKVDQSARKEMQTLLPRLTRVPERNCRRYY